MKTSQGAPRRHSGDKVELLSVVLMSFAAILSAWFAFQSSAWSGLQSVRFSAAMHLNKQAEEAHLEGNQAGIVDAAQFMEYARAISTREEALAKFLYERFRPEMRAAVDAWLATKPLENSDAPKTPFRMKEYRLARREHGDALDRRSTSCHRSARAANYNAERYHQVGVTLAITLFFAGLAPNLATARRRWLFLAVSGILTIFVLASTIGLPTTWPEDPTTERDAPIDVVCGPEGAP